MGRFWAPIVVVVVMILHYCTTDVHTAPPVEPCPNDSILVEDICKCDPSRCSKPPCLATLTLKRNATRIPGDCCPLYECHGCQLDDVINGKCPCAPGAILNDHNECLCNDPHRKLINNECVCNPDQCELPHLCDHRSIPFTIEEGCCNVTRCLQCPDDSFVPLSIKYNETTLEPKCVCYPCTEKQCGPNETVIIKQKGNDFPGNCCDIYECQPITTCKMENNQFYKNGEKWLNDNFQNCECKNGLVLCSEPQDDNDELFMNKSCHIKGDVYKHNETWFIDNGCTICNCLNGRRECIAHICDINEMEIIKKPPVLCTPLTKCNKTCPDGYKINRKGCEICKCNNNNNHNNNNNNLLTTATTKYDDLLEKYNITKYELKLILEEYFAKRNNEIDKITTTTSSTTTTTTTTTSTTAATPIKLNITNNDSVTATTTVADLKNHTTALIWLASILSFILFVIIIVIILKHCIKTGSYNTDSQSKLKRYKIKGDDFFNNCLNNTYECKESMLKK